MKPEVRRYSTIQKLSTAAAEFVCQLAERCVNERGTFTLALSGGGTPRTLYELLAQEPYVTTMPWVNTHIFWGDERFVPPEHADSNFAMVSQALLNHVPVPAENIHRIPTDLNSPEEAATQYETALKNVLHVFDPLSQEQHLPVFDLLLLGMGNDGHTASLFPDSQVLEEQKCWVAATPIPHLNPPVRRITLTFPVINAAKTVLFLISGGEKHRIVQTILETPKHARALYPAARVNPHEKLLWFLVTE